MFGKIEWQEGGKPREEIIAIDGVAFAVVRFAKEKTPKPHSVRRAAKKLRRMGVRQIVLPQDMPSELWQKYRLLPISTAPLRDRMSGEIVRTYLRTKQIDASKAHLVLCGEYVTDNVLRCAEKLCRTVRYCSLCFSYGAEEAANWLCKSYGVAVRVMQKVDERATLCVCFSEQTNGAEVPCLALWDEKMRIEYSDGREEALLAALLQSGVLPEKTLRVKSICEAE